MKVRKILYSVLISLVLCNALKAGATSMMGGMAGAAGGAAGGDKKEEAGSTVNVISQNAVESSGNQTQSFLDRLERRETIVKIRKTINVLSDKLKDIQVNVQNRLNQINASG